MTPHLDPTFLARVVQSFRLVPVVPRTGGADFRDLWLGQDERWHASIGGITLLAVNPRLTPVSIADELDHVPEPHTTVLASLVCLKFSGAYLAGLYYGFRHQALTQLANPELFLALFKPFDDAEREEARLGILDGIRTWRLVTGVRARRIIITPHLQILKGPRHPDGPPRHPPRFA